MCLREFAPWGPCRDFICVWLPINKKQNNERKEYQEAPAQAARRGSLWCAPAGRIPAPGLRRQARLAPAELPKER